MLNRSPRQISGRKPVLTGPAHRRPAPINLPFLCLAVPCKGGHLSQIFQPKFLQNGTVLLRFENSAFCAGAAYCRHNPHGNGGGPDAALPVRQAAKRPGRASVQTLARPGFNRITYSKNSHTASESPPSAPGLLCRRAQGFRLHIRSGSRFPRPNAWPPAHSR